MAQRKVELDPDNDPFFERGTGPSTPASPPSKAPLVLMALGILGAAALMLWIASRFSELRIWLPAGLVLALLLVGYGFLIVRRVVPRSAIGRSVAGKRFLAFVPVFALAAVWSGMSVVLFQKENGPYKIAREMEDLLTKPIPADEQLPMAIRGKAMIYDHKSKDTHPAQKKLQITRSDLVGTPNDNPVTLIAVMSTTRQQTQTFPGTGKVGYRQEATVRIIFWPERKLQGEYKVQGVEPYEWSGGANDKEVVGEIDQALADWVGRLPNESDFNYQEEMKKILDERKLRSIVDSCKEQINREVAVSDMPPAEGLHRKLLVWDVVANKRSPIHDPNRVGFDRVASAADTPVTVIAVLSTRDENVKTYGNGQPGYRRDTTVAVVNWPDRTLVGRYLIKGDMPPDFPPFGTNKIVGDHEYAIIRWLQSLPIRP